MQDFLQFVVNHWAMWSLFVALLVAVWFIERGDVAHGIKLVSAQDATNLINREGALVVDIRDKAQFNAGHIVGARHFGPDDIAPPFKKIGQHLKKLQKFKTSPIIVVCQDGRLAPSFARQLRNEQFLKAVALKGGINEWHKQELPLVFQDKPAANEPTPVADT